MNVNKTKIKIKRILFLTKSKNGGSKRQWGVVQHSHNFGTARADQSDRHRGQRPRPRRVRQEAARQADNHVLYRAAGRGRSRLLPFPHTDQLLPRAQHWPHQARLHVQVPLVPQHCQHHLQLLADDSGGLRALLLHHMALQDHCDQNARQSDHVHFVCRVCSDCAARWPKRRHLPSGAHCLQQGLQRIRQQAHALRR